MHAKSLVASLVGLPLVAMIAGGAAAPFLLGPATGDVEQAQETTAVLAGALVAGVVSISDASPPDATPEQLAAGSEAVSLLFSECQRRYRLIDASGAPLDPRNKPHGSWESNALADVVGGAGVVQEVVGGQLRTVVGLTNDMHPNCVSCHTNYAEFEPGTVIGAASFGIKIP